MTGASASSRVMRRVRVSTCILILQAGARRPRCCRRGPRRFGPLLLGACSACEAPAGAGPPPPRAPARWQNRLVEIRDSLPVFAPSATDVARAADGVIRVDGLV